MKTEKIGVPIQKVYQNLSKDNNHFNSDKETLIIKGHRLYVCFDEKITYMTIPLQKEIEIYGELMTGREFYNYVDGGSIINYDGISGMVFVDGYKTNLGLAHKAFYQGNFMVNSKIWLDICANHEVLVEWRNK